MTFTSLCLLPAVQHFFKDKRYVVGTPGLMPADDFERAVAAALVWAK